MFWLALGSTLALKEIRNPNANLLHCNAQGRTQSSELTFFCELTFSALLFFASRAWRLGESRRHGASGAWQLQRLGRAVGTKVSKQMECDMTLDIQSCVQAAVQPPPSVHIVNNPPLRSIGVLKTLACTPEALGAGICRKKLATTICPRRPHSSTGEEGPSQPGKSVPGLLFTPAPNKGCFSQTELLLALSGKGRQKSP